MGMTLQMNDAKRCKQVNRCLSGNEFCYLIHISLESKLDAYWLKEDIVETLPDVKCDFVDDTFQTIRVSSKLPLRVSELKSIFNHYKMDYNIVSINNNRRENHSNEEVLNSLLNLI